MYVTNMKTLLLKIYPKKIKNAFERVIATSKSDTKKNHLAELFIISLSISVAIAWIFRFYLHPVPLFIISATATHYLFYIYYYLQSNTRAKSAENQLSEILEEIAIHLKSGSTTEKAIEKAIYEFNGPLVHEFNEVLKKLKAGSTIESALYHLKTTFNSDKIANTIDMLILGLKSGGELYDVLLLSATSLDDDFKTEKEIKTNVNSYIILIMSTISFGMPALFALANMLSIVIVERINSISVEDIDESVMPFSFMSKTTYIDLGFINGFSIAMIVTTVILGSFAIGLMRGAREQDGSRYIFIMLPIALSVYFSAKYILASLIGFLLP